jgi:pimeloyl-ACP methyl ester carboxylesterase
VTTLSVTTQLPTEPTGKPPVIFVHGAGTSGAVWTFWQKAFVAAGWPTYNLDLRGHGESGPVDLSHTSIFDYVADVNDVAGQLKVAPVVIGWSMGGHIAVIAASQGGYAACVALDPDPPVDKINESVDFVYEKYSPQDIGYVLDGDPDLLQGMPDLTTDERRIAQSSLCSESELMGSERRRGILIDEMPCPMLEILGGLDNYYPTEPSYHGIGMANRQIYVSESSHWGLMLNRRELPTLLPQVLDWLDENV